jgi:hypothetical protein
MLAETAAAIELINTAHKQGWLDRLITSVRKKHEEFLQAHRKIGMLALSEWMPILGGPESAGWLITVVTKADLWWNRRDEVLEFYKAGAYYNALGSAKSLHPSCFGVQLSVSKIFWESTYVG